MLKSNWDNREIKSFRLRSRKEDLKSFFLKENSIGVFVFADSLIPSESILLKEQLAVRNLQLSFCSKTIFKFLLKGDKTYNKLYNLLQGDVFLIKNNKDNLINDSDLKVILNQPKILVRFLYLNQAVYRPTKIKNYINTNFLNKDIKQIPLLLNHVIWDNTILNKSQYNFSNYVKK